MSTVAILALGALCGGFVTGLAGFGTGLTALGLWLHVVSPAVAAALVVVCSVAGQIQSLDLAILGLVLCTYGAQGLLTRQISGYALACLPATILGATWASGCTGGSTTGSSVPSCCGSCSHRASC